MKKIYNAALLKQYTENVSVQEADKQDVVADEKPANFDMMKNLQTLKHKRSNCESNYKNILPHEFVGKTLLCAIERSGYTLPHNKSQAYHSILKT